ncbi:hypothetical protein KR018_005325 [Drosophila ironensis]|nr:hypothetical protein KR018_005325 [Drosophila ironensis]
MEKWLQPTRILCVLLLLEVGSLQARLIPPNPSHMDHAQLEAKDTSVASLTPRADDNSEGNYRLPNNTSPEAYRIAIWTNVHNGTLEFGGTVEIDLLVLESSAEIKLHYRQTQNFTAFIIQRDAENASEIALNVETDVQREFLVLTPTDGNVSFPINTKWTLTVNYNGTLRTDMGGFHRTSYTDDGGIEHFLAATQFESTNARHAFPCYDEPARRANFTITIVHDPSYTAISNMPVNESVSSSGITVFETTPLMSTYLVAFVVSDFESTSGELNSLRQRVLTQKGKLGQQQWALWSGLVVESSLADYFGVDFPLPKLDQAGIPGKGGAMENWGLATYGEQYMVWSKENSTIDLKTSIANIIGHEYAHMWFGDLVSIQWWTYLWLKEGFATIFSYESNDIAFPEWDTYQIYHVQDYNSALINDALTSAVPMTHYVQTPAEISSRYNTFSYAKPSAVLYMFKNAWSDAVFKRGLNKYLTKNQYTSCDEWDLFAAFQESANELGLVLPTSVDNIFSSWSQQAGYPLLTVTRDYSAGTFTVTQRRYLADDNTNDKTWYVPINFATASKPDYRNTSASHYLLNTTETVISDAAVSGEDWLILNLQNAFYYRTLYDEQNYQLLVNVLNEQHWKIHHRNRAQLLYDAYFFVETKRLDLSVLLNLLTYLKDENQYAPWSVANTILSVYNRYLRGQNDDNAYQLFAGSLIEPVFDKIGVNAIPGEHYLNNYLRNIIVGLACEVDVQACIQQSYKKLSEFLFNGTAIEPTLKTKAYCAGLRNAPDFVYQKVVDDLLVSTDASDRSLFISSLGCSVNPIQVVPFFLLATNSSNGLTHAERTSLLNSAYTKTNVGVQEALGYLESHWNEYGQQLTTDSAKPLDADLRGIASYVVGDSEKSRLLALVEIINANGTQFIESDLSSVIEVRLKANFDWLEENQDTIINWATDYLHVDTSAAPSFASSLAAILVSALCLLLAGLY